MKTTSTQVAALKGKTVTNQDLIVSHISSGDIPFPTVRQFHPDKFLSASFMNDNSAMGWIIDENEKLIWANTSFKKYFNLTDDAISNNVPGILPIKVIDGLYEKHVHVLNTGKPAEIIQQVKLANGEDIIFHVSLFPVKATDGKIMIGGQAFRLPGENNFEKKVLDTNEHLLLLRLAGTDAIWEWNMKSGDIFRNDTLMKMIGYPVNETDGLAWWFRRIHPGDRDRVSDKVKEATDKQLLFWEDEYRFKCADGDYKKIHDHGYIVYENGLPVKMIGSLHDVSKIKLLQEQLQNEKLQQQKELSETVIKVQEIEKAKIGYELHDNINQIVSTAKLFVDMFKPDNAEQEHVKEKGLEYLVMAIEEIRKLSKELVTPQFKEKGIIASMEKLIGDINISAGLHISFIHDGDADKLSDGKKVALFRIVQEQIKNIITHSHAKRVEIKIHRKEENIELIISDNGIGFDSSETRRGIGLSSIYERTKFYNGKAEIKTEKGKGCTLAIHIPC